jgi:predicted transcriptional regulator
MRETDQPSTPEKLEVLLERLRDEDRRVRRAAAEALREMGEAAATPEVLQALLKSVEVSQQQALRKSILIELLRRGRAFPVELAAATFTFVENIQPVLEDLEKEGLVRIRQVAGVGMEVIELTPKGRDAIRHAGGP